ncbi:Uncharacterized protein PECH_007165 [Penicillium ucsense]|uniref:Uncharacterized protein n=2 Tax=Penicillium TaxID=5073 RepID=A0A8J8W6Z9_9EURO|nr:uncharacterized protein N7539_008861 [Penicillium diatomitis]KAF7718853.1 Uncharacterized protein PECM_000774 [Penicillium ucsense]KAF7735098.1 Uncharacterized protein PECH_007165 [Penicillium ucsense]KAJ5469243.1 hypothetical protein N7539_008861 [Penicillium diatomitis]
MLNAQRYTLHSPFTTMDTPARDAETHHSFEAPPPYYNPTTTDNTTTTSSSSSIYPLDEKDLLLTPGSHEPGLATSAVLTRGLQIPTRTGTTTSGFPYPAELAHFGISQHHWQQFTELICEEAKLSRQQWSTVIGKGLGTLALGGLMIGALSAIPAIWMTRHVRRRQEQRNFIAAMAGARGERLATHISEWNETFFRPRGVMIRVDLPDEYINEMDQMDVYRKDGKYMRSVEEARDKAALKARIVIIPVDVHVDVPESSQSSIQQ